MWYIELFTMTNIQILMNILIAAMHFTFSD